MPEGVLLGRLSYLGCCLARGFCFARKVFLSRLLSCLESCLIQVVVLPEGFVLLGKLSYQDCCLARGFVLLGRLPYQDCCLARGFCFAGKVILSGLLSCQKVLFC